MLPNVEIICVNKSFEKSFNDIPDKFDLLLSNHCIDDMIIAEYMKNYSENLNSKEFKEVFLSKEISTIIMSQYKSNLYFKDSFKEMDEITEKCFKKIKNNIVKQDIKLNLYIKINDACNANCQFFSNRQMQDMGDID